MVDSKYYLHPSDKAALKALKTIPGFTQLLRAFMKVWSERQYRITNMSSCIRMNDNQLKKYYDCLPPICEKLGIDIPELYLELNVNPNSYTSGDTRPFVVITSGLLETIPEELVPTVLAHECGHIACHHVLYSTMGRILLDGSSIALRSFVPFGDIAMFPLSVAFFYWMRCSELSADRAAVLCDGTSEKMSEVCMRLAGFDKDVNSIVNKEEFFSQAQEYRDMVKNSKWDKTLEFLFLRNKDHPLMTVRAIECQEWGESEEYKRILDGSYLLESIEETDDTTLVDLDNKELENGEPEKATFSIPLFRKKKSTEQGEKLESKQGVASTPDEIRKYKELLDDGIITEEEFTLKKKQLLNI